MAFKLVDVRPVSQDLLRRAAECLGDDIGVPFIEALRAELLATEPLCDHSVGICACGTLAVIEELQTLLDKVKLCPECLGDGVSLTFSDSTIEGTTTEVCTRCGGKGRVPL